MGTGCKRKDITPKAGDRQRHRQATSMEMDESLGLTEDSLLIIDGANVNHQNDTGYYDGNVQEEKTQATTEPKSKTVCSFPAADIRERKKEENLRKFNASSAKEREDKTRRQSE